jgi:fumarylacetoacetase
LGSKARRALRIQLFALLKRGADQAPLQSLLTPVGECGVHLPASIFTDFFASINHARNAGSLFRPYNPLLPNYKYVPVGYHGRSSSIQASGKDVIRPREQTNTDNTTPVFGACARLDYEVEIGFWIGSRNAQGHPVPIGSAGDQIAGLCLLNDWSARDIQAWEYQPLGPFLAKNFATTISPWVITPEALAPFRTAQPQRPAGDPLPLPHLTDAHDQSTGAFDITIESHLITRKSGEAESYRLGASNTQSLYWTAGQLVAHHTSGGCNLNPGDLPGSGTISGTTRGNLGSLLEITRGGRDR